MVSKVVIWCLFCEYQDASIKILSLRIITVGSFGAIDWFALPVFKALDW